MSPENKNVPPSSVLFSGCRPARKQTRIARLAGPARNPFSTSLPFPYLYSRPRSHRRERANHISMTSLVQKRARVEGWRGRATRKVLCRGAPELAGFTRAVTKHLLSLAAVPRTRLPQARLPLVCYCLFFYHLLSTSNSSSSSSSSSCSILPLLFPHWALPLHSFWYRAAFIWKLVPIVPRVDLLPASTCRKSLRLFAKRYNRYLFRQDSSMSFSRWFSLDIISSNLIM